MEVAGLTALPLALFALGIATQRLAIIRAAAVMTLLGVIVNRLNVSVIAFGWYAPVHYVPSWMEVVVTAAVISAEIWVFRWVINHLPVLGEEPTWARRRAVAPVPRLVPDGGARA